jgi:hypothetical protein
MKFHNKKYTVAHFGCLAYGVGLWLIKEPEISYCLIPSFHPHLIIQQPSKQQQHTHYIITTSPTHQQQLHSFIYLSPPPPTAISISQCPN